MLPDFGLALLAICVTPRISRASWAARNRESHEVRSEWQPKLDGIDAWRDDEKEPHHTDIAIREACSG